MPSWSSPTSRLSSGKRKRPRSGRRIGMRRKEKPDLQIVDSTPKTPPKTPPAKYAEVLSTLLLVLGTGIIIVAILGTLADLRDRIVYTILVPGIVIGLALVLLSLWARRRLEDDGRDNTKRGGAL